MFRDLWRVERMKAWKGQGLLEQFPHLSDLPFFSSRQIVPSLMNSHREILKYFLYLTELCQGRAIFCQGNTFWDLGVHDCLACESIKVLLLDEFSLRFFIFYFRLILSISN